MRKGVARPVRILQIHNRYRRPGGEDEVVRAEAAMLRRAGHEVVQHYAQNPADVGTAAGALSRSMWNTGAARAVGDVVRRTRPELAHVHNTWFALTPAILPAIRAAGVPVVMTLHNYRLVCVNGFLFRAGRPCLDCVGTHPGHGVVHRCYKDSYFASAMLAGTVGLHSRRGTWATNVNTFVVLSQAARQLFVASGLPAERLLVKPNFTEDPGPRELPPSASREVLFVGRLDRVKGISLLVEAWNSLSTTDLKLVVVGDGEQRRALERVAGPSIELVGWSPREAVRHRMQRARALVFPSVTHDPFGLVVLEAMATGLPVLATDLGGAPETLGSSGMIVPAHDVGALAEGCRRLADDALVDDLGARNRRRYEDHYTPAANLPLLEAVYSSVLADW